MKFIYFCVLCGILTFNLGEANLVEKITPLIEACIKEFPITADDLTKATSVDQDTDTAPEDVKCFIRCLLEKQGTISKDSFDFEKFTTSLQNFPDIKKADVPKAVGKCKALKGKTECDRVYKIIMCTSKELHTSVLDM